MSRTITPAMQTHLNSEVTSLATCWELTRRDGVVMYFTDHDLDIEFGGNTYLAASGFTRSAIEETSALSVDNMELIGLIDSETITVDDVRGGKYDYAQIDCFMVNHEDPDAFSSIKMRTGFLGQVSVSPRTSAFIADFRGLLQNYSQRIGSIYQATCRVDLGDSKCSINLDPSLIVRETAYAVGDEVKVAVQPGTLGVEYAGRSYVCTTAGVTDVVQPAYNTAIDSVTTDGTAEFTCKEALTQYGTIVSVTDARTFEVALPYALTRTDDYFNYGVLQFVEGENQYKPFEVKDWIDGTSIITIFLPLAYTPQVGQTFKVTPGCNKHLKTCRDKFNNVANFRGEPFVPGIDQALSYPDAKV